jgi:hypothetical protein
VSNLWEERRGREGRGARRNTGQESKNRVTIKAVSRKRKDGEKCGERGQRIEGNIGRETGKERLVKSLGL